MAWCPKCRNEYREGITSCLDCGCSLVEEEQLIDWVSLLFGEKEQMESLKKYLEYNKLQQIKLCFDEKEQVYELFVDRKEQKTAQFMTRIFLEQQEKGKQEINRSDEEDATKEPQNSTGSALFVNSAERAEENRSSAWVLLIVGALGMTVMILGILDIIPLKIGNPYLFYGIMSAVFLLFIVMGVVSMKNAKLFERKAESENSLRDALLCWSREHLSAESVDAQIEHTEDIPEEALYFRRFEIIRRQINHQFMNLDQGLLDKLIDTEIYDQLFPEKGDTEK